MGDWIVPAKFLGNDGQFHLLGSVYLDGATMMGYVMSQLPITTFDNSDAAASVAGSATVTVRTISGKGTASLVTDGTGSSFVTMKYAIDGGADVSIGTSDKALYVAVSFNTTLVLKAVNSDSAAHNRAGISSTGAYQ